MAHAPRPRYKMLRPPPSTPVGQHIVSKGLLERFAVQLNRGSGLRVVSFDLDNPGWRHRPRSPSKCARIENFVQIDQTKIEDRWNETERHLPKVFEAIDSGHPFDDPRHVALLRDLIALHLVRSHWYRDVHDWALRASFAVVRNEFLGPRREQLAADAARATGHVLDGPFLETYLDQILAESTTAKEIRSGQIFRDALVTTHAKVRRVLQKGEPELIEAQSGEFIIGDAPAIALRWDELQPDPLSSVVGNVPIGDANSIILPVGPHHVLAMGPKAIHRSVGEGFVARVNAWQVANARHYVFFKPSSATEAFVRAECGKRKRHDPPSERSE